jgi:hypothetical protein
MLRRKQSEIGAASRAERGSSSASIRRERAEILRLIGRLRHSQERAPSPALARVVRGIAENVPSPRARRSDLPPTVELPLDARAERLAQRRRDLEEVQALRRRVEDTAPSTGVMRILRSLEERLVRIEERLASGGALGSGPAPAEVHALAGVIQPGLLADILQLVSSNTLSGVFRVDAGTVHYHLFFDEGQIVHADGPALQGEEAFYAAFAVTEGKFIFDEGAIEGGEATITGNTQFLILEALRRIDEVQGE